MKNFYLHFLVCISTFSFFNKVEAQTGSVTFFVVSDTHCDPVLQYDLRAISSSINEVARSGSWPATIGGVATGFMSGPIGTPQGVVFTGDLMGWGNSPQEIPTFRHYFERGNSSESINFPGYIGLGNHDVEDVPGRSTTDADDYRRQIWNYVDGRHKGPAAPVPVTAFDAASHAYSWDVAGVHFVQTHRYPGDNNYSLTSNLDFLRTDLSTRAADGRPVVIFHHYGMDAFGTEDRWWEKWERDAYRDVIRPYNVAGIFVGHSHAAFQYTWEGQRVFQVNNAKAENGTGNNDGNGSFAIVRITGQKLEVVTCRWIDDQGHYEMIAPYYSGPATNQNPVVAITAPANNATFTAPAAITISANASDADGTISKVEFYNGTTLLNTDITSPYSYNWTNVAAGNYSITAKVTDNAGNTSIAAVSVVVAVPESPYGGTRASIPGIVQAENYDLGGQNVAFSDVTPANEGGAYRTDAVDIESIAGGGYNVGYVQAGEWMKYMVNVTTAGNYKLEAYVAATAVGKSFTLDLDGTTIATVNVPNTGGWQNWQVVALNNISLTAGNKVLRFNAATGDFNLDKIVFSLIPNLIPTISMTSPTNNATFTAPSSVTISANASDADGTISKVEFYNGTTLLNTDITSPYSYTWAGVTAGTYSITAKAYDNSTGTATSSAVSMVVSNLNQNPIVSLTSPTNNATFTAPSSVTISANASDADGTISKVEFYNGTTLLNTDITSPYSYTWAGVTAGTYSITAKAYDNSTGTATSSAVSMVVSNLNQNPIVSLTSPTNNATFTAPASVTISANASDADGTISKVEFYNGTALLNTDITSPYSYTWTGVTAGTYSITAKAYDNSTGMVTSSIVTITVNTVTGIENCANILPWKSTSIYVKDDLVTYKNVKYKSKWWTKDEDPSVKSSDWDVWIRLGECMSGTAPSSAPTISMIPDHESSIDISESVHMNVMGLSVGSVAEVKYFIYKGIDLVSLITKTGEDLNANWEALETGSYVLQVVVNNSEGYVFSDARSIEVSRITSTDDRYSTKSIVCFPNPATETLYFNEAANTVSTVNVFDLSGTILDVIPLNGSKQINLSKYASGVYLIQFISTNQSQFVKVIKE